MKMNPSAPRRVLAAATTGLLFAINTAHADITYLDAVEGASGNTYATGGLLDDTSWIDSTSNAPGADDLLWVKRFGGSPGWTEHNGGDAIQGLVSGYPNELTEITTEITGLAEGNYDVWIFFWEQAVSGTQNWMIDAGLTSGSLSSYSSPIGPVTGTDSTSAVDAGTLTFSNAPSVTGAGGNQTMFGVNLGPATVVDGSSIKVYVDKLLGTGSNNRTIFDGVGYEFVSPLAPPALLSTNPDDDAMYVVITQNLVATFDVPVQAGASGNITLKRSSDNSTVEVLAVTDITPPGTVTFDGSAVTIDPTDDLVAGADYYVLIEPNAIESTATQGYNGIIGIGDWSFTTDGTPPSSTGMTPMAGSIGAQPNPDLSLSFDEDVQAVAGKFLTIHLADGTVVETIEASSATITGGEVSIPLSASLTLDTSYYVNVEAGAFTDLSGNPYPGVAGSSAWNFTTVLTDITYVDAVDGATGNTFATGSGLADIFWIGPDSSASNETQWNKREGVEGNNGVLYQGSSATTPPPELTTQITGLADGIYTIWAFYWDQVDSNSQNWVLSAGLTSGALTTYSSPGEPAIDGATTTGVTNAANLTFTNPVSVEAGFNDTIYLRNLFGVELGQVEVAEGAAVEVYLGNNLTNGSGNRAWYDGVGYQLVAGGPDLLITAFTSAGTDLWELSLVGSPDTSYQFRSSDTLTFTPGTLITGLTQGDPGDPGTVGGSNNSRLTTDGEGHGTVQMTLAGARNFVRAQRPPPLLSEDFEGDDDGGFLAETTAGTAWTWGEPISSGISGFVTAGNGGSKKCWGTGIGNPGFYANPTNTCLRSPVIDLTGVTAAELTFAQALDLQSNDRVTVNIIDDTTNSAIAEEIVMITDQSPGSSIWQTIGPIAIPAAALNQAVRIEWCLDGTGGSFADYLGWYLDDVVVTDTTP